MPAIVTFVSLWTQIYFRSSSILSTCVDFICDQWLNRKVIINTFVTFPLPHLCPIITFGTYSLLKVATLLHLAPIVTLGALITFGTNWHTWDPYYSWRQFRITFGTLITFSTNFILHLGPLLQLAPIIAFVTLTLRKLNISPSGSGNDSRVNTVESLRKEHIFLNLLNSTRSQILLLFGHRRLRRNKKQTAVMHIRKYKSFSGKKQKRP